MCVWDVLLVLFLWRTAYRCSSLTMGCSPARPIFMLKMLLKHCTFESALNAPNLLNFIAQSTAHGRGHFLMVAGGLGAVASCRCPASGDSIMPHITSLGKRSKLKMWSTLSTESSLLDHCKVEKSILDHWKLGPSVVSGSFSCQNLEVRD